MPNFPGEKQSKRCFVVGSAPCDLSALSLKGGDYLIGADGGCDALREAGLTPHYAVGDWDSGNAPQNAPFDTFPTAKDDTDMLLAVKKGIRAGCEAFYLYGGLGGARADHSIANISVLFYLARRGKIGFLIGERQWMTVVENASLSFQDPVGILSVFSMGGAEGVCEKGVLYTAENLTLTDDFPLGVSNEFTEKSAEVSVRKGALLVVCEKACPYPYKGANV